MRKILLAAMALCLALLTATRAQAAPNYVEQIIVASDSNVNIEMPESIMKLLFPPVNSGSVNSGRKTESSKPVKGVVLKSGVNKMSGYRIQVFSESQSGSATESRAKARASAIAARFPKYRGQVYTFSKSPSWYCRVGNFMTKAEADKALSELRRAFPKFAGEMRLVQCQISVVR